MLRLTHTLPVSPPHARDTFGKHRERHFFGNDSLIAGTMSLFDKETGQRYAESAIGQEVGTLIGS